MNHINAGPQDGEGEISKRERAEPPPTRKKNVKNRFHFNVNWAAMGVLVTLIGPVSNLCWRKAYLAI